MKKLVFWMILAVLAGCSKGTHHSVPDDLIYIDKDTVAEWQLPQAEMDDSRVRFTGPDVNIIYDDGGVIVEQSREKYRSIKMVELASGHVVILNSDGMKDDELQGARMTLDGQPVEVEHARVVHKNGAGVWIDVLTPARKRYLLVM